MSVTKELSNLFKRISAKKIYGSVEIYFEAGEITQITQRIISKVKKINVAHSEKEMSKSMLSGESKTTIKVSKNQSSAINENLLSS